MIAPPPPIPPPAAMKRTKIVSTNPTMSSAKQIEHVLGNEAQVKCHKALLQLLVLASSATLMSGITNPGVTEQ